MGKAFFLRFISKVKTFYVLGMGEERGVEEKEEEEEEERSSRNQHTRNEDPGGSKHGNKR